MAPRLRQPARALALLLALGAVGSAFGCSAPSYGEPQPLRRAGGAGPAGRAALRCAAAAPLAAASAARAAARRPPWAWPSHSRCTLKTLTLPAAQPPRGNPPPPLAVANGRLVDATTGAPVAIKGINWFGFNNGQGSVDGLWAGGSDAATDFLQLVYQVRLLGFNAVRVPFRWGRAGGVEAGSAAGWGHPT
jgi:hypothetical protein